jgi:hypothetical protein
MPVIAFAVREDENGETIFTVDDEYTKDLQDLELFIELLEQGSQRRKQELQQQEDQQ